MLFRRFALLVFTLFLIALISGAAYLYWEARQPRENQFDPIIVSVATTEGVDPFLVRALIWRESRFNPQTLGTAQEHGLMQVTPVVGQEWAKAHKIADYKDDDLFDPTTNIRAGTWYLSHAIRRWNQTDDPVAFGLAEYNAGRSNALKWVDPMEPQSHLAFLERITFPTTRKYVEVILEKREEYRITLAKSPHYREFSPPSSMTITP